MTFTGPTELLRSAIVLIPAEAVLGRRVHRRRKKAQTDRAGLFRACNRARTGQQ
jgi:hypothetical protein